LGFTSGKLVANGYYDLAKHPTTTSYIKTLPSRPLMLCSQLTKHHGFYLHSEIFFEHPLTCFHRYHCLYLSIYSVGT